MADDRFKNCDDSIQRDLDEISEILTFVTSSLRAQSKAGEALAYFGADKELRPVFEAFRACKLNDYTPLYQSLYVKVWACFEAFVRGAIEAYLETFLAKKADYETLEKHGIASRNLILTGDALRFFKDDRRRPSVDFSELIKNISSSVPGSAKVALNTKLFSIRISGPSAQGLTDALSRVGFDLKWDDFGSVGDLQKALRTKGNRETANQLEIFLKEAARRRHSIVHRVESSEVISAADVVDAIAVFRALAISVSGQLKSDCERKCS